MQLAVQQYKRRPGYKLMEQNTQNSWVVGCTKWITISVEPQQRYMPLIIYIHVHPLHVSHGTVQYVFHICTLSYYTVVERKDRVRNGAERHCTYQHTVYVALLNYSCALLIHTFARTRSSQRITSGEQCAANKS